MPRVSGQWSLIAEPLVTLSASSVAGPVLGQLIVGIAFMERVTGQTGESAALVAGRFQQSVVFATGDPNHAVRPKEIAQKIGITAKKIGETGGRLHPRRTDDGRSWLPIITGAKAKAG